MEAKLVVVGGKANMGEVKLRLPMTIGRGRKADLIISHPTVSRIHCELYEKEGALVVRDNGSSNGTFIEDQQIKEAIVEPGQILKIGPLSFRAEYEWSGSMPDLNATAEVRDLSATQTMSDDLLGEGEASDATVPPQPPKKAKPAAPAPAKEPAVARAKSTAEPAEKKPKQAAAPPAAPAVAKDRAETKTVDSDAFDFNKDIEFVDDASQPTIVPGKAPERANLPTIEFEPLGDVADEEAAPEVAAVDESKHEANFDFLEELGAADDAAPAMEPPAAEVAPVIKKPAPAAGMPLIEPSSKDDLEFDFLAELDAPAVAAEPAKGNNEPTIGPPLEDAVFEEPVVEPLPEPQAVFEIPVEPAPQVAGGDFDFLAAESVSEPTPDVPEVVAPVEAPSSIPDVSASDEDLFADFLAEEPAPPPAPEAAAAEMPAIREMPAVDEAPAAEEWPAVEETPKSEEPEWSFEAEPQTAAEVVEPFVEAVKPSDEAWPTIEPPVEEQPVAEQPATEQPAAEEAGFDFLADMEPAAAAEPEVGEFAPSKEFAPSEDIAPPFESASAAEPEPTIDFRGSPDDEDEPPVEPQFSFDEPDAAMPAAAEFPADEATAASAFSEDTSSEATSPAPEFAFGEAPAAAEPTVAPIAAAAPRPAAAKKPSFIDKIKLLFVGSKKAAKPAKGKLPAAKKPAETLEDVAALAAAPFVVPSFSPPRRDDAPIPLFDDVASPAVESSPPAGADEFVDEFLNEPAAPPAEDAPIEAPAASDSVSPAMFGAFEPASEAAEPAWTDTTEPQSPPIDVLDDAAALFGEAPAAETPSEPAPAAAAEDDFAAFLADEAPAPAMEEPHAVEPSLAAAAEDDFADFLSDESQPVDAPPAEPEIAAVADLPADEELFPMEASAPTEAADVPDWTTEPTATESPAAAESNGVEDFLFAAEPGPTESQNGTSPAEVKSPADEMLAEAPPAMVPPPATAPSARAYSMDVDTRLTASHRAFARVPVKTPRIEVPHMEPDMPAGRNFHRTGPATVSVAAPSPLAEAPAEVAESPFQVSEAPAPAAEEPAMINPAEDFIATSDDVVAAPQKQADAELDDFLSDLGMGDEPNRPR